MIRFILKLAASSVLDIKNYLWFCKETNLLQNKCIIKISEPDDTTANQNFIEVIHILTINDNNPLKLT